MEKIKLGGSTQDLAECIIDYKTQKIELKGVPDGTIFNILKAAIWDWAGFLSLKFLICTVLLFFLTTLFAKDYQEILIQILAISFVGALLILTSLHLNPRWDKIIKKRFAIKTGETKRDKMIVDKFTDKEFIIYDIKNVVVEFEASGDVNNQLSKVWIKLENPITITTRQANIKSIFLRMQKESIWNAHFFFEEIPKDGELSVEWI